MGNSLIIHGTDPEIGVSSTSTTIEAVDSSRVCSSDLGQLRRVVSTGIERGHHRQGSFAMPQPEKMAQLME